MNENNNQGGNVNSYAPNNYNGPVMVSNAIPEKSGGKAVGSLVCGIISILGCWSYVTVVLSIVGIVLGIVSIAQQNPQKGMAIAGIITSVIGLLLSIGIILLVIVAAASGMV